MTRVVIDVALAASLHDIPAGSELCDPNGRIVGHFLPPTAQPFVTGESSRHSQRKNSSVGAWKRAGCHSLTFGKS